MVRKGENTGNHHFSTMFFSSFWANICHLICKSNALTHYKTTNFRLFQTDRVCSFNFKFDEIGRKLSKQVENTVGKGEIARYKQFLLFPQCFQKACFPGASKGVIVWEWVNPFPNTLFETIPNSKELQMTTEI